MFTIRNKLVRRSGVADITYNNIETLTVNGGTGENTFNVQSTAVNRTTINGSIGNDTVTVTSTAARSILLINTFAGDDDIDIFTTGNRSVTKASASTGEDELILRNSGNTSGVQLNGDADNDLIRVDATGNVSRTSLRGDGGLDEIFVSRTGTSSLTDVFGGANSDRIQIGNGTLDFIRGTISVRGEAHDASPAVVRSGARANFPTCSFTEFTVQKDRGDLLVFDDQFDAGSDRFTVREPAPVGFPRYSFQRTGSALVQFDTVESLQILTGAGNDNVLFDRIAMVAGVPVSPQPAPVLVFPFLVDVNGGAGRDGLEVRGTAGNDRITVGSTTNPAVQEVPPGPAQSIIMVTGIECLDLVGNAGNDALVNNTSITSVLSGGFSGVAATNDKDVLIGGDAADVIYGGPDVDALFGRGGSDFLFADFDENGNVSVNGSEIIDGGLGGVDNAVSLGIGDVICNIEGRLVEEGAIKDVVAFLQAQLLRARTRRGGLSQAVIDLLQDAELIRCDRT